jgi:hypothetical protein
MLKEAKQIGISGIKRALEQILGGAKEPYSHAIESHRRRPTNLKGCSSANQILS